jgi:hypothetical protein
MLVSELIKELKKFPSDVNIEINDNSRGIIHTIDQIDFFPCDPDYPVVVLQVNVL